MKTVMDICRKEFNGFFASPAAWLFLATFLAVNLFVFFWAEAFFARNIASLKPLFQWMPILLIFLVATLTMRSWSEERRAGTLESLLTAPVAPEKLILGKFLAGLALVTLALTLTLPLPVSVAMMGPLDWGPVWGGYLASLFLAAAYLAIGLYMSARTDNPIVALILTVAAAALLYLIGSDTVTALFSRNIADWLVLLGTGSRFDAITRGVLDLRDLMYYLTLVVIFLALNRFALERLRWAGNPPRPHHRRWQWLTALILGNAVLLNIWLGPIGVLRADLTQGRIYSLSDATRHYLHDLQEPLLIRGYFSARTHPLLAPLVPQLHDLLKEYQVAGGDHVRVEFIDPHSDQALETEAAEKYGIRPVPFRLASRYESGVVNAYFNLVIAYGDQFETLDFHNLIDIKVRGEGDFDVLLKDPEYAITSAIRKVVHAYRTGGNLFTGLQTPLVFHAYISPPAKLPPALRKLRQDMRDILNGLQQQADGKLTVDTADPDAGGGVLARRLRQKYGFGPQIASLLNPRPFWFYMVLEHGKEHAQIPLPAELDKASLERAIRAAIQRMSPGFMKTVAIVTPPAPAGFMPSGTRRYSQLRAVLADNVRVEDTDLKNGHVPASADLLLLLAPEALNDKQLYAVDQFLMQGGTIIVATSPFSIDIGNTLTAREHESGLRAWLHHLGLDIDKTLVLDPNSDSLPIPVQRQLGGITVREIRMAPYPLFADIRDKALNPDHPITAALHQLTVGWASPLRVDTEKNRNRRLVELVRTSADSWVTDSTDILPRYDLYPETGFRPAIRRGSQLLAVAVQGRFPSWFRGKSSPLLKHEDGKHDTSGKGAKKADRKTVVGGVIDSSADSARIVLIASNEFGRDTVADLLSEGRGSRYTRQFAFIQNAIDWALQDEGLLSIRGRSRLARTLAPMDQATRLFWEYLNYGLALFGLGVVWLMRRWLRQRTLVRLRQAMETT